MGGKRTWKRKYLYFSIACMTLSALAGCAILKQMEAKRESREYLTRAQSFLDQGDYEGSLKESQKVLSSYSDVPPGDEALFIMGLIYAHCGYPKKDYRKSIDLFKRLVRVFPRSPRVGQAKLWIGVVQENERLRREIEDLNKTLKKSKQVDIDLDEKKKELSK